jgi:hypothetical protein
MLAVGRYLLTSRAAVAFGANLNEPELAIARVHGGHPCKR